MAKKIHGRRGMVYRISVIGLLVSAILLVYCAKKTEEKTSSAAVQTWTPPADSTVSPAQLKVWLQCNPLLDSLSYLYKDSLSSDDTEKRISSQKNFQASQERICVKTGLPGGYKQYIWIARNMGNPKNAKVLDSANLSLP